MAELANCALYVNMPTRVFFAFNNEMVVFVTVRFLGTLVLLCVHSIKLMADLNQIFRIDGLRTCSHLQNNKPVTYTESRLKATLK